MPLLTRALTVAMQKAVSINLDPKVLPFNMGVMTTAGVKVAPAQSPQAAAIFAATTLISDTVGALPSRFQLRGDRERIEQRPESVRALWDEPNPDQSLAAFWQTAALSMLLWGEYLGDPVYNKRGDLIQIWPVNPDAIMDVERHASGAIEWHIETDEGIVTRTNHPGQRPQLWHVPWRVMPGQIRGMSPIEYQAELVGQSLSAQQHSARFLGTGVHLTGVIEAPDISTEKQAKDLSDSFHLMHSGPKGSGKVGILTGKSKFVQLTVPPVDLQFVEQQQYSDRKMASVYRVPPHMIGDTEPSTSWGTGLEEQTKGFAVYTIVPFVSLIERAVRKSFLSGTNLQMHFELNGLLRGNPKDRASYYKTLWDMGWLNADEGRELEDMRPIGGEHGSRYYIQGAIRGTDEPSAYGDDDEPGEDE